MALVLVIATDRRMGARHRAKVGSGGADRLDAGFLVIGDHRDGGLLCSSTQGRPPHLDLTIDAKHLGHFGFELAIAPLQVVTHPVRFDLMRGEDLAHRSLGQVCQAWMASARSVIARMRSQQSGGPQLVRITKLRRLRASQPDKPGSGLHRNPRIPSRARAVVQRCQYSRCQYSQFGGTLQTARHALLAHPHRARHGIGRRLFEIGQNNPRPLHSVRRLRARSRNLDQCQTLVRVHRQCNNPSRRNHGSPCHVMALHTTYREDQTSLHNISTIWNLSTRGCFGLAPRRYRPLVGALEMNGCAMTVEKSPNS